MVDIGIVAVGGYNEVGRNMTAIRIDKDIVIMDMGIRLDSVQIHEDVEIERMHSLDLIQMGAIPDDTIMNQIEGSVRAIVCTHGHLDHIGAVSKLAHRYKAPIIATPFTMELISQQLRSERKFRIGNTLVRLNAGETYRITDDIELEFIRVQHSIPDCVFAALHTRGGTILYANDFKFDRFPILNEPVDERRLRQLGREGVLAMIVESTRVDVNGKTPSENVAKDLVMDVITGIGDTDSGIIVTTFSSHIARILSVVEAASRSGRVPVLLGRSMDRYWEAVKKMEYIRERFPEDLLVAGDRKQIDKILKRIVSEGKEKYLPIVTGHQGEPGAILTRIGDGDTPYEMSKGDKVIFSATIIPTPMNAANRYAIETKLRMKGVRIYTDIHVSGHAAREDHWELMRMINPTHVIPSHGNLSMTGSYAELAEELGYVLGEDVHLLRNGQEIALR
ncbi:MAG TPA: RNase J family beta-CASP ribonuclease [Candidatus Syntrophoarchaeum butanivorans]|uniref:Ribonuclease J n=1 Tax=Candidatus Syntropharchaeum butanivorans TaxID=1839936 RepID=A0A1F2P861_9EURY|nr:MAG: ribonuclease J [Candidatus Syntrophoarchaeum butanivorans]RJS71809.1 MAG: RNase J family beta-CASP ribonuclease [Candidatus Syntrophoarchaeum sp. WYZ-LMO15]HDM36469.1 RNase J family beta-CASP ribonuclease [Candidatus Syntrophoarchaeum butanivorans]HEC57496.1 RNase J family beta-CASP ribonuclease [Candidatus Syntrophoarchaeum butanivorans]